MNVLYLEDDPAYVELIMSTLETAGYRVHAVSNGNQAIRHLESSVVDLLILDWRVAGRIARHRQDPGEPKAIVLSVGEGPG